MWLELAKDERARPKGSMDSRSLSARLPVASDNDRLMAASMRDVRERGASPPSSGEKQCCIILATVRHPPGR